MKETFQTVTNSDRHDKSTNIEQRDPIVIDTATRKWVRGFNCIPRQIVEKLIHSYGDVITEITPATEKERDSFLPLWGTMFSFEHPMDNEWLDDKKNLRKMADCGFRIYRQEDYGYIFGIDGAGYDFYEVHWIPLYKARGLRWN